LERTDHSFGKFRARYTCRAPPAEPPGTHYRERRKLAAILIMRAAAELLAENRQTFPLH
jgi:hypothetical protein